MNLKFCSLSTVSVLHVWLDGFPEDWDTENLQRLLAFTSKRLPNSEIHVKALHRYVLCTPCVQRSSFSENCFSFQVYE